MAASVASILSGPVSVCLDRPVLSLDRPFTYRLPEDLQAGVGSLVTVSFHRKRTRGWILGPTDDIPPRMLPVTKVESAVRFFDERSLGSLRWIGDRSVAPLASVISAASPPRVVSEETEDLVGVEPPPVAPPEATSGLVAEAYRHGDALADALDEGSGAFVVRPIPEDEVALTVRAVRRCLTSGRRAIVIVPEVDPEPATVRALAEAFGDRVLRFFGKSKRIRYREWLELRAGRYDVVIGTRATVLAPVPNLGLIWISRESHAAHRQERSPYFRVREVAWERSRTEQLVSVASALCPSVETASASATQVTPARRSWVPVEVVKPGPEGRATRLATALRSTGGAFLFEPIRGYGIATTCRSCGDPAACGACGGMLRQEEGTVRCIVCEAPGRCSRCGSTDFGLRRGGIERVEEWAASLAPIPVRPGDPENGVVAVGGTDQVHDVGAVGLDLVGILDADLAARRPGLGAQERALAVWMEAVAWARPKGRAIVVSGRANEPLIQALVAGNPERFYRGEIRRREEAGFPVDASVFRVRGTLALEAELEALDPATLLVTTLGDEAICLLALRPEGAAGFASLARSLAERGIVTRVEADPHL